MSTALSDLLQKLRHVDSLTDLEDGKRAVRERYKHVQGAAVRQRKRPSNDPVLAAIAQLDTLPDLQKVMTALDQRFATVRHEHVERLVRDLKPGDRVRLSPRARPKYLCGRTAIVAASPNPARIKLTLDDTTGVANSYLRDDGTVEVTTASVEPLAGDAAPAERGD